MTSTSSSSLLYKLSLWYAYGLNSSIECVYVAQILIFVVLRRLCYNI